MFPRREGFDGPRVILMQHGVHIVGPKIVVGHFQDVAKLRWDASDARRRPTVRELKKTDIGLCTSC